MPFRDVDRVMTEAVENDVFPGAVLRVSFGDGSVYENAYGSIGGNGGQRADTGTVYDLASLTKPLSTAPAFMILVQQGKVRLETRLGDILPEFNGSGKETITVAQLLTHTSGLPDYRPYYKSLDALPEKERVACLRRILVEEPLIGPSGVSVVYSDLGYMILAWIIEQISGQSLPEFVKESVYDPLGVDGLYCGGSRVPPGKVIAPTEVCPWRKRMIRGEVHDENAWVMGGFGGHAGLFGTARGVDHFLGTLLGVYRGDIERSVFQPPVLRRFLTEWDSYRRTPGFDMPSLEGSSSGRYFSRESVGHLGFTGTSFWMDLRKRARVVLLSNRVFPSRDNINIRAWRPLIHDTVMLALEKKDLF